MAIDLQNSVGRQYPLVASQRFTYADVVDGVAADAIQLPGGARVTGGGVTVVTPFNSATSDVLDVGDAGSGNRYTDNANIAVAGYTALVPTGKITTAPERVTVMWDGTGAAPTQGEVVVDVEYVMTGRAQEVVPAR
jgi:hypothetical protein